MTILESNIMVLLSLDVLSVNNNTIYENYILIRKSIVNDLPKKYKNEPTEFDCILKYLQSEYNIFTNDDLVLDLKYQFINNIRLKYIDKIISHDINPCI